MFAAFTQLFEFDKRIMRLQSPVSAASHHRTYLPSFVLSVVTCKSRTDAAPFKSLAQIALI